MELNLSTRVGLLGFKAGSEQYCHPRELAGLLAGYERWSLGVEMALAFNLAIVMALVVYMFCTRSPGSSWCCSLSSCCPGNGTEPKREYHHLVSSENKSNNLVVDMYTDEATTSNLQEDDDLNLE